jgi:hypothetical protein
MLFSIVNSTLSGLTATSSSQSDTSALGIPIAHLRPEPDCNSFFFNSLQHQVPE